MSKLFPLLVVFGFNQFLAFSVFAQTPSVLFESVVIETDAMNMGSKGLNISGKCDLQDYRKTYPSDSLMVKAFWSNAFYLSISVLNQDSIAVKPAMGFAAAFPEDKICTKIKFNPNKLETLSGRLKFSWFVPYAALKLDPANQEVTYSLSFSGKDGFNKEVSGKYSFTKVTFVKPRTRVCEVQLDSVRVNKFDVKGRVWDANIYAIDKPDLEWSISIGEKKVFNVRKENSYAMDYRLSPKVFKFLISEGDEVHVILVDIDEFLHDPVAYWSFNCTTIIENKIYKENQIGANVAALSFSYKAGPLK